MIDVILGAGQLRGMLGKHVAKDVAGPYMLDLARNRPQYLLKLAVGDQALPVPIVFIYVMLEIVVDDGTIVAPGVAAEQLVATRAGQYDLNKLAGKLGHVEIRVALTEPRLLDVPHQPRHNPFHVTGLQHDLVM